MATKGMPRRTLAAMVAAGVTAVALVGCTSDPAGGESAGPVTLTLWTRGAGTEELAKRFNSNNTDIQVEVTRVTQSEYVTKLGAAVSSGEAPDILDLDVIWGPLFASNGILLDITDRVKALDFADQLNAAQMDLATYNDAVYSVPNIAGPSVMMYNKELFSKAGLDPESPPTTWAELEDAAARITALGDGVYGYDVPGACSGCLAYVFFPLIWANGGNVFAGGSGVDQTTTFGTDPAVAEAFSFVQGLWEKGYVNPADQTQDGSTWGQSFASGKLGILVGTPESYPSAVEAGIDVGVAPIPGKDGGFSTFVGGDLMGITAASSHPEEAWRFVQWILEPEQQEYIAELALVPTRLDMLSDEFSADYPASAAGLQAMEKGVTPNSLAWNSIAGSDTAPFVAAYQKIVFGGAEPGSVLPGTDQESLALIKEAAENAGLK